MPKSDYTIKETLAFIHNAQLACADQIKDIQIPGIYSYTQDLLESLQTSSLTPIELSTILISAAWKIMNGGLKNGSNHS